MWFFRQRLKKLKAYLCSSSADTKEGQSAATSGTASNPPPAPETSQRSGPSTGFNALKLALQTLSSASDNIPVPGVKVAVDTLLNTIKTIQVRFLLVPSWIRSLIHLVKIRGSRKMLLPSSSWLRKCNRSYHSFGRYLGLRKQLIKIQSICCSPWKGGT
jgi:hypothetical protein